MLAVCISVLRGERGRRGGCWNFLPDRIMDLWVLEYDSCICWPCFMDLREWGYTLLAYNYGFAGLYIATYAGLT